MSALLCGRIILFIATVLRDLFTRDLSTRVLGWLIWTTTISRAVPGRITTLAMNCNVKSVILSRGYFSYCNSQTVRAKVERDRGETGQKDRESERGGLIIVFVCVRETEQKDRETERGGLIIVFVCVRETEQKGRETERGGQN